VLGVCQKTSPVKAWSGTQEVPFVVIRPSFFLLSGSQRGNSSTSCSTPSVPREVRYKRGRHLSLSR